MDAFQVVLERLVLVIPEVKLAVHLECTIGKLVLGVILPWVVLNGLLTAALLIDHGTFPPSNCLAVK